MGVFHKLTRASTAGLPTLATRGKRWWVMLADVLSPLRSAADINIKEDQPVIA